jgi:hypothetical protein
MSFTRTTTKTLSTASKVGPYVVLGDYIGSASETAESESSLTSSFSFPSSLDEVPHMAAEPSDWFSIQASPSPTMRAVLPEYVL